MMTTLSSSLLRFVSACLVTTALALHPWCPALAGFPASAGYTEGSDFRTHLTVAPGVEYTFESRSDGPMTFHTVEIDTSRPDLRLETEAGEKRLFIRETVPDMMARNADPQARPIVGINGGFWAAGNIPVNMFIDEGMIWKGPRVRRGEHAGKWNATFAFDDQGNYWIGLENELTMHLRGGEGQFLLIDKVNFHEEASFACVYTWPFGDETADIRENQAQIVLNLPSGEWLPNAPAAVRVTAIDDGPRGRLDGNTVVIHADLPLPGWIKPGAELTLDARLPALPGKVIGAVGGIPRLVVDGVADPLRYAEEEAQSESFVTTRHPRTAVGIKDDGKTVVWVVVDGRQTSRSIGIDLMDLADYMLELGCVQALNLDGGGSSTLAVRGEVTNFPSDPGGARSVGNALFVRRLAALGEPVSLRIEPNGVTLPAGALVDLSVTMLDAAGEPVGEVGTGDNPRWSVRGNGAAVTADGRLLAGAPGEVQASVTVERGGGTLHGSAVYTVHSAERIAFRPVALLMEPGESAHVTIIPAGEGAAGFYRRIVLDQVSVPPFAAFDAATGTLTTQGRGAGWLEAALGETHGRLAIASGIYSAETSHTFDTLPAGDVGEWIEHLRTRPEETTITLETENRKEGAASWRLTYAMAGGGTTRIGLPLETALAGEPLAVGLWVYGDGQGQWLRGDLRDSMGNIYKLDFTDAAHGISWKDEWRFLRAPVHEAQSLTGGTPDPKPPYTMVNIYLVQPQEAAKRDGEILFDGLTSIELPAELRGTMAMEVVR